MSDSDVIYLGLLWKDTTSYSRGEERAASCWTASLGPFRISVIYCKGKWVVSGVPIACGDMPHELDVDTREQAMFAALELFVRKIEPAYQIAAKAIKKSRRGG